MTNPIIPSRFLADIGVSLNDVQTFIVDQTLRFSQGAVNTPAAKPVVTTVTPNNKIIDVDRLRELAGRGYPNWRIAAAMGVTPTRITYAARDNGISIARHKTPVTPEIRGKVLAFVEGKKIDAALVNRVAEELSISPSTVKIIVRQAGRRATDS